MMKSALVLAIAVMTSGHIFEAKSCEELKAEIAAKLDNRGVRNYVLDIVDTDKVGNAKVVASCDGGSKKITYAKQ
jgi:hypothetical protein